MPDALIWGASGGMGRALVQTLSARGWRVFGAARDTGRIPGTVTRSYRFDATAQPLLKDIALDLAHETAGLDLWVYAAGGLRAELLKKMGTDAWAAVLDANLTGAFMTFHQTAHLINDGGAVVFIGAYVDHLILPKMGAYAAAKAGLETLVDVLQKEHRTLNVSLVKPGAVATAFWEDAPFKLPANAKSPQTVAEAIVERAGQKERGVLAL